jgi:hypothetical protein
LSPVCFNLNLYQTYWYWDPCIPFGILIPICAVTVQPPPLPEFQGSAKEAVNESMEIDISNPTKIEKRRKSPLPQNTQPQRHSRAESSRQFHRLLFWVKDMNFSVKNVAIFRILENSKTHTYMPTFQNPHGDFTRKYILVKVIFYM